MTIFLVAIAVSLAIGVQHADAIGLCNLVNCELLDKVPLEYQMHRATLIAIDHDLNALPRLVAYGNCSEIWDLRNGTFLYRGGIDTFYCLSSAISGCSVSPTSIDVTAQPTTANIQADPTCTITVTRGYAQWDANAIPDVNTVTFKFGNIFQDRGLDITKCKPSWNVCIKYSADGSREVTYKVDPSDAIWNEP